MAKYGIYITFDQASQKLITSFKELLFKNIENIPSPYGKMQPHITLLIFDEADERKVIEHYDKLDISVFSKFTINLNKVSAFTGKNNVVYLAPEFSSELNNLQANIYHNFIGYNISVTSMPSKWVPHCTITKKISVSTLNEALEYASSMWQPNLAKLQELKLINVAKPLDVISSKIL